MRDFIFYTWAGFTQDADGNDVENCQVLGRVNAANATEAKTRLLEECPWVHEHHFDEYEMICKEIMPTSIYVVTFVSYTQKRNSVCDICYSLDDAKVAMNNVFDEWHNGRFIPEACITRNETSIVVNANMHAEVKITEVTNI